MSLASTLTAARFAGPAKEVPAELFYLLLIMGLMIFMWDLFERKRAKIRKDSGLTESSELISLKGSAYLPSKVFRASKSGLYSRPDALLKDGGHLIPVDIKPLSSKVQDRHVLALLLHMRAIEEVEGSAPPYGLLLMGKERRQVKIKNSEEKRIWLDAILEEMRSIEDGVSAVPAPQPHKCRHCDVRALCKFSAYTPKD